jgi:hypothetical protein
MNETFEGAAEIPRGLAAEAQGGVHYSSDKRSEEQKKLWPQTPRRSSLGVSINMT